MASGDRFGLQGQHVFVTATDTSFGHSAADFLRQQASATVSNFTADDVVEGTTSSLIRQGWQKSMYSAFRKKMERWGTPTILLIPLAINERSPIWEVDTSPEGQIERTQLREACMAAKEFVSCIKSHVRSTKGIDEISIIIAARLRQSGRRLDAGEEATRLCPAFARMLQNEFQLIDRRCRVNTLVVCEDVSWSQQVFPRLALLASSSQSGDIRGQHIVINEQLSRVTNDTAIEKITLRRPRRMRICLSIDFDALSGYLGTGHAPENTLADYSAGILSANVGVGRLLWLFRKHGISDKVTWFLPGHSMETFPEQTAQIVASGAEIGLHGYSHEGAYAMTVEQEKDVLEKCIDIAQGLTGKRPAGYRAPLYQIRETTVKLLQEHGFLYDSSMNAHDSLPYFLPIPPIEEVNIPNYSQTAKTWMVPTKITPPPAKGTQEAETTLVEIPGSWYTEDMTPMGYYPYTPSTQGYVSVDVVEEMWWNRFDWLWENESWLDEGPGAGYGSIFPLIWHPESSGRSHIVGMIDRFIGRLVSRARDAGPGEIVFETMEQVTRSWKQASQEEHPPDYDSLI